MPTPIKAALSVFAVLVAMGFAYYEYATDRPNMAIAVLVIGAFMTVAMWLFPEAGTDEEVVRAREQAKSQANPGPKATG